MNLAMERDGAVLRTSGDRWSRSVVILAASMGAILLIFHRDAVDIVDLWWNSSTFTHCLLIPPIIAWLIWQRWPELKALTPRVWLPGLLLAAAGSGGWLLGDAAGVAITRQYGLLLMLLGAVVTLLGPAASRGLLFPLCYTIFLIPAGEELVPPLQTLTARMCMGLLGLAGVHAHLEGVFITISNGYFEVAEACSGVKFLIAMIAYGALVGNVCFLSWPRRIAFMIAAVIAPIVANGVRAWGTIYVAHLSDSGRAAGFDHIVYGWIFFAIVIGGVMAAGWRFFDRPVNAPWMNISALEPAPPPAQQAWRLPAGVAALLLIAVIPHGWGAVVAATGRDPAGARIVLPHVRGWQRIEIDRRPDWQPHFDGPDASLFARYRDARGDTVDLAIVAFAWQQEGRELVGFGQGAVGPNSAWAWTNDTVAPTAGRAFRISAPGPVVREVATFYRIGDVTTGSNMRVKLETLERRLFGGSQRAVAVLVSAREPRPGESARPAIDSFLRALGPIDRVADAR